MTQVQSISRESAAREARVRGTSGGLEVVPLPTRLDVPVVGCKAAEVEAKTAGTAVALGDSLLTGPGIAIAPADGRVVDVVQATLTNGQQVPAVRMELSPVLDDADGSAEHQVSAIPVSGAPAVVGGIEELAFWTNLLHQAGVWADRQSCPDLLGQFAQLARRPADTVVCSLLDHDAPLRLNALLVEHEVTSIVAPVGQLAKLLSARQPIFAIGGNWPAAVRRSLELAVGRTQGRIAVIAEPNSYPDAAPQLLLARLLDRRLRPGRLPVEKGVVFLDGAAALAMGECIVNHLPMLRVPLAVHDCVQGRLHYVSAAVGTSIREVLKWLGVKSEGLAIHGGHILRQIQLPPDAVVGAAELELYVMPVLPPAMCGPCTRCEWCAEYCPMGVRPAWIVEAAHQDDETLADQAGMGWCIECGICDSVCPSRLPLLQTIRKLKQA